MEVRRSLGGQKHIFEQVIRADQRISIPFPRPFYKITNHKGEPATFLYNLSTVSPQMTKSGRGSQRGGGAKKAWVSTDTFIGTFDPPNKNRSKTRKCSFLKLCCRICRSKEIVAFSERKSEVIQLRKLNLISVGEKNSSRFCARFLCNVQKHARPKCASAGITLVVLSLIYKDQRISGPPPLSPCYRPPEVAAPFGIKRHTFPHLSSGRPGYPLIARDFQSINV